MLEDASCERVVYLDHIVGRGAELFDKVRAMGAEGIVSKHRGSLCHGRKTPDWLKTKCHETARFVITGFQELDESRLEAVHVAAVDGDLLRPAGQVRFGFAGKGLWGVLDQLRAGPARGGVVPVHLRLVAEVKFFGRYNSGAIRDGVLLNISTAEPSAR